LHCIETLNLVKFEGFAMLFCFWKILTLLKKKAPISIADIGAFCLSDITFIFVKFRQ